MLKGDVMLFQVLCIYVGSGGRGGWSFQDDPLGLGIVFGRWSGRQVRDDDVFDWWMSLRA